MSVNTQNDSLKKKISRKLAPFTSSEQPDSFSEYLAKKGTRSPLYQLRKSQGFTLQRLALSSGISASYLSRIEARARRMNEEVINRLCYVLKCTPGQLLGGDEAAGKNTAIVNAFACDLPIYKLNMSADGKVFIDVEDKKEWIFRPAELTAENAAFCVRICDGSNAPKFRENDVIYVNPSKSLSIEMPVVMILKTKQIYIGKLISYAEDKVIIGNFNNDKTQTNHISELQGLYAIQMTLESHAG